KEIGWHAFANCDALKSVAIPASVREIGDEAFADCASDLTLYGAAGSVAEEYARENNLRFEAR
ncbi:MAG: leucine-rich repeat protein, partial [Thermoguttaceae bacterium]|nr:leucine-rich repeat protein [Thermoguttaceae bacterium]